SDVTSANNSIKDNIEEVRKEYITKLSNVADEKDLNDFYHLYLGEDFELLGERIERIVREKTEHLITKQKNVMLDIKNTESSYDDKRNKIIEVSGILSKQLSSTINAVSVDKLRSGITLVRNFTKAPIKFKPWGIVKLAKGLKFGGVALTALMESVNSFLAANKQNKFNAEIQEMKEAVSEYFREVKKMLSYEKFVAEYFPTIKEFDENVESKKEEINKQEQINEKLEEINKNLRAFEKSFE
ncbi:LeoA/HP0731 family dynamin-like GTPase, partial [Staphylococcus condimenti]